MHPLLRTCGTYIANTKQRVPIEIIEPRSHDDLPSVPTLPRIDPHYLFLTLFYPLYSSLYPLPRQQHTYSTMEADLAGRAGKTAPI
jgi:hypothetical protein